MTGEEVMEIAEATGENGGMARPARGEPLEVWLERFTVQCGLGRVTKKACAAMRARPTAAEFVRGEGGSLGWRGEGETRLRPGVCETCREWERQWPEPPKKRGRRKKQMTERRMTDDGKRQTTDDGGRNGSFLPSVICPLSAELGRETMQEQKGTHYNEELQKMSEKIADDLAGKTKVCTKCLETLPLEKFPRNPGCRHGVESTCRDCRRLMSNAKYVERRKAAKIAEEQTAGTTERQRTKRQTTEDGKPNDSRSGSLAKVRERAEKMFGKGAKATSEQQSGGPVPAKEIEATPPADVATGPLLLTINLSDYPELMEEIKRIATEEDRTPENQVRYWLRTRARGKGGTTDDR